MRNPDCLNDCKVMEHSQIGMPGGEKWVNYKTRKLASLPLSPSGLATPTPVPPRGMSDRALLVIRVA